MPHESIRRADDSKYNVLRMWATYSGGFLLVTLALAFVDRVDMAPSCGVGILVGLVVAGMLHRKNVVTATLWVVGATILGIVATEMAAEMSSARLVVFPVVVFLASLGLRYALPDALLDPSLSRCARCGYSLGELPEMTCPECGFENAATLQARAPVYVDGLESARWDEPSALMKGRWCSNVRGGPCDECRREMAGGPEGDGAAQGTPGAGERGSGEWPR